MAKKYIKKSPEEVRLARQRAGKANLGKRRKTPEEKAATKAAAKEREKQKRKDPAYLEEKAKKAARRRQTRQQLRDRNLELQDEQAEPGYHSPRYMIALFRHRAGEEYPNDIPNYNRYFTLKYKRWTYNKRVRVGKLEQNEFKYNSPGREGFEWLQKFCDLSNSPLIGQTQFNNRHYNIQQFYRETYANKVVDNVTCYDKQYAYVSWLLRTLPCGKLLRYCDAYDNENYAILYELDNGTYSYKNVHGSRPAYAQKLERIPGVDKWFEEYQKARKFNKEHTKKLGNALIGYMKKLGYFAAYYIWYKQGEELIQVKQKIEARGGIAIKGHTDSVAFIDTNVNNKDELDALLTSMGYKREYSGKSILIINSGCYHVEGHSPRGVSDANGENTHVRYEDGQDIPFTTFPCLKPNSVIWIATINGKQLRRLGTHNEKEYNEE